MLAECDYVENAVTSEVPPSLVTPKRAREMPAKSEEMPEETLSAPSSASLSGLPPINIGSTTRRSLGRGSLSGRDAMDEADVSSDDIYNSFERSSPGHFDGEDEYQESPLKDRVPVFEGASFLFSFVRRISSTSPPSSALHVSPSPPPPCVRASAASDWKPQIRAYIAELIRFAQAEDGGNLLREAHARRTKGDQVRHLDQRTFCALMKIMHSACVRRDRSLTPLCVPIVFIRHARFKYSRSRSRLSSRSRRNGARRRRRRRTRWLRSTTCSYLSS